MRSVTTAMAGLAFLAFGCAGSTKTSTGTTSGEGTTTGATDSGLLAGGQPCTSDSECASTYCGAPMGSGDAGGNCCISSCPLGKKPCQLQGCDGNGACYYPGNEKPCNPYSPYCLGNALTYRACNGGGTCEILSSSTCPGNFACNNEGDNANYDAGFDAGCNTTCTSSIDCADTFVCNDGGCVPPVQTGPCTENDDCGSGVCGIDGIGNCCSALCSDTSPPCGATDCDPATGACLYPDSDTSCGSTPQSCTGSTQTNPSQCDGAGNCVAPTTDCTPYACGPNACLTTCLDDGGCASGDFCCDGGCSVSFCGTAG